MLKPSTFSQRSWGWLLGVVAVGFVVWGSMKDAEAVPRILRPHNRPWAYQFSIGATGVAGGSGNIGGFDVSFRGGLYGHISNVIGAHFNGRGHGPALGGALDLYFTDGSVLLVPGARFWWDIPIARMAIYVAPFLQAGLAIGATNGFALGVDIQFGVEGKVVLNKRLLLTLKPIAFDLQVVGSTGGGGGIALLFNVEFFHVGVGVVF
ncbi:MAG: hypothetical protein EP343_14520 [Deltaproteobacteria bacterium]|nr:MAG: hypothetical protein EP343_14520 [Deltaproteobacteria bacterium]